MRPRPTIFPVLCATILIGCTTSDVHPIRAGDAGQPRPMDAVNGDLAAVPDLAVSWALSFPYASPVAIAAHPAAGGDLVVAGFVGEAMPVRFGTIELTSAGAFDVFVARFDPNGAIRWAKRFGAGGDDRAGDVAMDAAGNVALTGYFAGTVDFETQSASSNGGVDLFVLTLDADGSVTWVRTFGGNESDMGEAVAFGPDGIVVAGNFFGSGRFGDEDLTSAGDLDTVTIAFDQSGSPRWSRRYGGPERERVRGLEVDGAGNVALAGTFNDTADFGGVQLTSAGGQDAFIMQIDGLGATSWVHALGSEAYDYIGGPLFAQDGDLWCTGSFSGAVTFAGASLTSEATADAFLARLSSSGELVRVTQYGAGGLNASGKGLAFDGRGGLIASGIFRETLLLGPSELVGEGFNDIFVSQIDSTGSMRWAAQLSGSGEDYPAGVAVASGQLFVAGSYRGPATFLDSTLSDTMGFPMFVAAMPLPR